MKQAVSDTVQDCDPGDKGNKLVSPVIAMAFHLEAFSSPQCREGEPKQNTEVLLS